MRGRRLEAYAPHGHWKTLTFIAALRHHRIDAPWVIDGPINGETFLLYIEKILAPTLSPGDVVVLDNLGSHKGKVARAIVRAKGAHLIFLPPYSPDLNPIEQMFAKLKHLIRKAQPRDVEATWRKVGQLLDLFSPAECANLPQKLRLRFRLSESCSSDEYTVPVCRLHHRELHRYGDEASWWAGTSVDPLPIALELWRRSQSGPAAEHARTSENPSVTFPAAIASEKDL